MAQHGYLHDSYDRDDFGSGSDDDRERSWRDRDDERNWRDRGWSGAGSDRHDRERDRGSMFGWRDDDRHSSDRYSGDRHSHDRGFFERAGDEVSSWFGSDDDRHQDRDRGGSREWQSQSRWSGSQSGDDRYQRGHESDHRRSRTAQGLSGGGLGQRSERYSAHPDDHYRSWRDKQMQSLDRDYQDYCREREQQFHSDFDTWRQNRQGKNQGSMSSGQSQQSGSSSGAMELEDAAARGDEASSGTTSPMGAATLGTNNSENSEPGSTNVTGRKR